MSSRFELGLRTLSCVLVLYDSGLAVLSPTYTASYAESFSSETLSVGLASSTSSNVSQLLNQLRTTGFTFKGSAYLASASGSSAWLIIAPENRTFGYVTIRYLGDGKLILDPPLALPPADLRVVVSMHKPRTQHYRLFEKLAEDIPSIHVLIHFHEWNVEGAGFLTHVNPRWTLIQEPSKYFKGTENVKFLTHMALFWDQFAPLNAFVVDDIQDAPKQNPKGAHMLPGGDLVHTLAQIMLASKKPDFLHVLNKVGWIDNASVKGTGLYFNGELFNTDARCDWNEDKNPRTDDDTFSEWLWTKILPERIGTIPRTVSTQQNACFVVSASRLHDVMPSGGAYARILERSQLTKCSDPGERFEVAWPFLFSECDQDTSFFDNQCTIDRGTCQHKRLTAQNGLPASEIVCT